MLDNTSLDVIDHKLLFALQKGIPLVSKPFARLGEELGISGADALDRTVKFVGKKLARRLGGVFDSSRLGYASVLCAASVPEENIAEVAEEIGKHRSVTHSYERGGQPNLWFTVTALRKGLEGEIAEIRRKLGDSELLVLPATRRFKVAVILPTGEDDEVTEETKQGLGVIQNSQQHVNDSGEMLSSQEQSLVRVLQGNLDLQENLFGQVAAKIGLTVDKILETLVTWQEKGVLRRLAVILRHQNAGYKANGMCVWDVSDELIEAAGQALATIPEVTHCYQRVRLPSFPYTLYAMLHAHTESELQIAFERASARAGLPLGKRLNSVREFKKSSPCFFMENL